MSRPTEMMFDDMQNRWIVDLNDRTYGLSCGECFAFIIGSNHIPCRLELDRDWFIIMHDVRIYLRTQDTYRVML